MRLRLIMTVVIVTRSDQSSLDNVCDLARYLLPTPRAGDGA